MDNDLRKELENYKVCTMECISSLQKDDYNALNQLLINRQKTLNLISQMQYSNEEFNNLVGKFNILSNQKKLFDLIQEKKVELREKIAIIEKNKTAANSYNSVLYKSSIIFSKKI